MTWNFFIRKELGKYPFFFFLLFITLVLGTLGLTGISVVAEQVRTKLQENAKDLLTSDLSVSARRDLSAVEKNAVFSALASERYNHYKIVDVYSMVTHLKQGQTRLVEIRSTQAGFPFYGEIETDVGFFNQDDLFISKDLSELWSVTNGDELKIGEQTFKVKGTVLKDSSQGFRGFSLAPRIYLPLAHLEKTGLLKPGATGNFSYHYQFSGLGPESITALSKKILDQITDVGVKVTLPEESSEQTGRVIGYLTDFMSLAALIGLILSLVGVFYLYQSHLVARLKDLCLLNLHGLLKKNIVLGIILQFSLVFFLVTIIEMVLIIPSYKIMAPTLSTSLGLELSSRLNLNSVMVQLPLLYILSLAVLIPLLMGLLRTSMGLQLKSPKVVLGRFRFYDFIPFSFLLWGFACYLAHSFKTGSLFFLALLMVFLISTVLVSTLQWVLKRFIHQRGLRLPSLELGIALRNLARSGHKLTLSFLSLTMGAALISLILQLDFMIQQEFILNENKPGLFIFDIQEEQLNDLLKFAERKGASLDGITPMIRARLEKRNDKAFERTSSSSNLRTREDEVESRFRNRGINLTYRGKLIPSEKIVEGEPFPENPGREERLPYISLEKRFSTRMGFKLGDKLTFDVQGVEFEGIVRNFREVKWTSFYPNFFVNIEPGFIEQAPKTYLAVLPGGHRENKMVFQREAVAEFPNISFIDIEELVAKLSNLFERSRRAIEIISWLSLAVGLVILYGLSHDQVYRRYYDLALMKGLGFSASSLRTHLLWEFGTLFGLALTLGFFLGWLIALIIGREVFKISFSIDWMRMLVPGLLLSILCLVTILASSWKVVSAKPRELLSDA